MPQMKRIHIGDAEHEQTLPCIYQPVQCVSCVKGSAAASLLCTSLCWGCSSSTSL